MTGKKGRFYRALTILLCTVLFTACGALAPENAAGGIEEAKKEETPKEDTQKEEAEKPIEEKAPASGNNYWFSGKSPEEIAAELTLEQKIAQMLQAACYTADYEDMKDWDLGSVFSRPNGSFPTAREWQETVRKYQEAALSSDTGLPMVYGQDDVHGVNYCKGAVIFPHNIGLGAANDPALMEEIGRAVADEAKMTGMLWNFAPCLAVSTDPRWGRTYESFSSETDIVSALGAAYTRGLTGEGVAACAKHFFADGSETWGTGTEGRLIDRGSAELTQDQIDDLLSVYKAQIEAGAQTIMLSYGRVNGTLMHENAEYIKILREEMGFKGLIVTDYEAVQYNSGDSMKDKLCAAINAGADMLMEPDHYREDAALILEAVEEGRIPESRIDEAVTRILQLKTDLGLLEDPMQENIQTLQGETGSESYRQLAQKAVEESLVLLKNEGTLLPLKEGMKVYVTGPAADNDRAQCGGWTQAWQGAEVPVEGTTTILQGLREACAEKNIQILTDPAEAPDADLTLLLVGEDAYAEWHGDSRDLSLTGSFGLAGNKEAIEEAKRLRDEYGIPTTACIVAGRQVMIRPYLDDWDSLVMCYLPGTEGSGVASVLVGDASFHGRLPMPWYASTDQIGSEESLFPAGYGIVQEQHHSQE